MLGGLSNNSGTTFERFWKELPISFKYLGIATSVLAIFGLFTGLFSYIFANFLILTVNKVQIWRLFTSFLVDKSIINVIFNLYILSTMLPQIEKMYSTAYLILEILTQTILFNLIFITIGEILIFAELIDPITCANFGLIQLVFLFLWQKTAHNPEELIRFCFFPCLIPMKYLPWCFLALLIILGSNQGSLLGCLFGYYQHMVYKKSFVQLPLSFYNKMENLLPGFMKQSSDFVSIREVEAKLRSISRNSSISSHHGVSSSDMSDTVQVVGGGISIGSSREVSPNLDYKQYWLSQEEEKVEDQGMEESSRNLSNANLI